MGQTWAGGNTQTYEELKAERDKLHKCLDAGPDELCGEADCPVCALRIQRDDLARRLSRAEQALHPLERQLADAQREHKVKADAMAKELDQHKPSHDYRPMSVDVGECQRWRCSECGRESKAPVRAAYDPCPKQEPPCLPFYDKVRLNAKLADVERRAVEAEKAVGISVGIEESREGLMRQQNERIQDAEQRAEETLTQNVGLAGDRDRWRERAEKAERERDKRGAAMLELVGRFKELEVQNAELEHELKEARKDQKKVFGWYERTQAKNAELRATLEAIRDDPGNTDEEDSTDVLVRHIEKAERALKADGSALGDVLRAAEEYVVGLHNAWPSSEPGGGKWNQLVRAVRRYRKERGE